MRDPFEKLKLQVCIVDNGRRGSSYAALVSFTRVPKKGNEDPLTIALDDSLGIPPVMAFIAEDGVTAGHCMIFDSYNTQPTDVLMAFVKRNFPGGVDHPELYRFILIPLGMDNAPRLVDKKVLLQLNSDLRKFTMDYYDFENGSIPRLNLLGKISLPNPERYCEFSPEEDFTEQEEKNLKHQRTKAALCVSHGRHPTAKFDVKMMDLISPPKVKSVKYLKQNGSMIDLPVEKFEAKLARSRGITEFSFTSRLRISVLQHDFNEGKLPEPSWKFNYGNHCALSAQHDFHCFYNPNHPSLPSRYIRENELVHPAPPVYFAHIGAMNSYGVFASENMAENTLIDIYAGDVTDNHPNALSPSYSFLLHFPGHIYSNNQAVYAFDSGNVPPLINSAPKLTKANASATGAKANVIAMHYIYKKLPVIVYYTMPGVSITKDTQLLVDYEQLLKEQCPRHFSFFAKGTRICAAAKNIDYCKEDHAKGREYYAKKDFIAAKKSFKTAYHLIKANYDQVPAESAKLRLMFAAICEDMGDTYKHLDNTPKAICYFNEAIQLRKNVLKQTPANDQRISQIEGKLEALKNKVDGINLKIN